MKFSTIIHDTTQQQFRMEINGEIAKIDYEIRNGKLYLLHSEVPYNLRGQGIGKVLVEKLLNTLKQMDCKQWQFALISNR